MIIVETIIWAFFHYTYAVPKPCRKAVRSTECSEWRRDGRELGCRSKRDFCCYFCRDLSSLSFSGLMPVYFKISFSSILSASIIFASFKVFDTYLFALKVAFDIFFRKKSVLNLAFCGRNFSISARVYLYGLADCSGCGFKKSFYLMVI